MHATGLQGGGPRPSRRSAAATVLDGGPAAGRVRGVSLASRALVCEHVSVCRRAPRWANGRACCAAVYAQALRVRACECICGCVGVFRVGVRSL